MVENLKSDEEVTIIGPMGYVLIGPMGYVPCGPEIIFSVATKQGKTCTFLASSTLTKGYDSIAIRNDAQVKAKYYTPDTESYFVDQAQHPQPDFVAVEYQLEK